MALGSYINNRTIQKPEPFRDAVLFIVICEGGKREPEYFAFFDRLTRKIKVEPISDPDHRTAPQHLLENTRKVEEKYNEGDYELWFILDTDRWEDKQFQEIIRECNNKENWNYAISNPCFEVWLYFHFERNLPDQMDESYSECTVWKQLVDQLAKQEGGFDSNKHPTLLRNANENAENNYQYDGYYPTVGSTQIHFLGQKLYQRTREILDQYNF